jgi:hypothetical protein
MQFTTFDTVHGKTFDLHTDPIYLALLHTVAFVLYLEDASSRSSPIFSHSLSMASLLFCLLLSLLLALVLVLLVMITSDISGTPLPITTCYSLLKTMLYTCYHLFGFAKILGCHGRDSEGCLDEKLRHIANICFDSFPCFFYFAA